MLKINVEDAVLRHPDVADAAVFGVTFANDFRFLCSLFLLFDSIRYRNQRKGKFHVVFM